jgi:hypothetical protein
MVGNIRVVRDFSHDLDPGLIGQRTEQRFPHNLGPIGNQNANRPVHGHLLSELN